MHTEEKNGGREAQNDLLAGPETQISGKDWVSLIYDPNFAKSGGKGSDIVSAQLEQVLNDKNDPDRKKDPEASIYHAFLVSHLKIGKVGDSKISSENSLSVSVVRITKDAYGSRTAVIGHDGSKTNVYAYHDGKVIRLTTTNEDNYFGMEDYRYTQRGDKSLAEKIAGYTPTTFSVPIPNSAEIFLLTVEVFDLFSEEEIAAYFKKTGNFNRAITRLVRIAKNKHKPNEEKRALVLSKIEKSESEVKPENVNIEAVVVEQLDAELLSLESKGLKKWLAWLNARKPYRFARNVSELYRIIESRKKILLKKKRSTNSEAIAQNQCEMEREVARVAYGAESTSDPIQPTIIPADQAIAWIKEYLASAGKERSDFIHDLPEDLARMVKLFRYFPTNH